VDPLPPLQAKERKLNHLQGGVTTRLVGFPLKVAVSQASCSCENGGGSSILSLGPVGPKWVYLYIQLVNVACMGTR